MTDPELVGDPTPTDKVTAAGAGGALAALLIFLLHQYAHVDVDAVTSTALATLLAFAAGYLKTERRVQ